VSIISSTLKMLIIVYLGKQFNNMCIEQMLILTKRK